MLVCVLNKSTWTVCFIDIKKTFYVKRSSKKFIMNTSFHVISAPGEGADIAYITL